MNLYAFRVRSGPGPSRESTARPYTRRYCRNRSTKVGRKLGVSGWKIYPHMGHHFRFIWTPQAGELHCVDWLLPGREDRIENSVYAWGFGYCFVIFYKISRKEENIQYHFCEEGPYRRLSVDYCDKTTFSYLYKYAFPFYSRNCLLIVLWLRFQFNFFQKYLCNILL